MLALLAMGLLATRAIELNELGWKSGADSSSYDNAITGLRF